MILGEVRCGFFQKLVLHAELSGLALELTKPGTLTHAQRRLITRMLAPIRPAPDFRRTASISRPERVHPQAMVRHDGVRQRGHGRGVPSTSTRPEMLQPSLNRGWWSCPTPVLGG